MNKIVSKLTIFFLLIGLTSCSYSPIFSEKNYNFEIDNIILIGEKEINNVIENKLKLIRNNESTNKKKYNIEIISKKNINTISKDSKGDPLKFEMIAYVEYKLTHNEISLLKKKVKKNSIYNNDSDKFELEQSEKIILKNLSESISDTIISSIINLDDN